MTSRSQTIERARSKARMDFVFVIDEITGLQPSHDTSVALMEAAQVRGHRVLVTTAADLGYAAGQAVAVCQTAALRPAVLHDGSWLADPDWFTLADRRSYRLGEASAIFMRTDPPVDANYLRATYLLDLVDPTRTLMVNAPAGLRNANEKFFALRLPDLGPPTLITADPQAIRRTVTAWGKAVLKPTDGMAGRGILILDPDDPNLVSILETATMRGRCQVVVQKWLPASSDGDRRVIVLAGRPIGVVRRLARDGEFRCNMAAGATVTADTVTDRDREICERLAPLLDEHGLTFVGIDVIGDRLTEVNVTSPTGIREIDVLSGSCLADEVIGWAESRCRANTRTK